MPRKAAPRKARKRTAKRTAAQRALATPPVLEKQTETETSDQAITAIAQDAVLILRRGMAYHADRALHYPQTVQMHDCVALLRLVTELGPAAARGSAATGPADYSRLSPEELAQYAALSLKVDYA